MEDFGRYDEWCLRDVELRHVELSTLVLVGTVYWPKNGGAHQSRVAVRWSFGTDAVYGATTFPGNRAGRVRVFYCNVHEPGFDIADIFSDTREHDELLTSSTNLAVRRHYTSLAQRGRTQRSVLTVMEAMDGSVEDIPFAERAVLCGQLGRLLHRVLVTNPKRIHGKYLLHGDLRARNVLYRGDGEAREFFVSDFDRCAWTTSRESVEREIEAFLVKLQRPSDFVRLMPHHDVDGRIRKRRRPVRMLF